MLHFQYRHYLALLYGIALTIDLMSASMLSISLPSMQQDLHVNLSWINWLNNLYALAIICIIPSTAWLVDRWGSRKILIGALLLFALGSILCGISSQPYIILLFRTLQGIGGGLLIPVGQSLVFQHYSQADRHRITTAIQIPASVACAFAPYVGGYISDHMGWRYCFLLTGVVTFVISFLSIFLRDSVHRSTKPLDKFGLATVIAAFLLIFFGINAYTTSANFIYFFYLIVGVILLILFYVFSKKNIFSIFDVSIFNLNSFRKGLFIFSLYGLGFNAFNIATIFYLQKSWQMSAHQTGIILLYYAFAQIIMMYLYSHYLYQVKRYKLVTCGCTLFIVAISFYVFGEKTVLFASLSNFIAGAGAGLIGVPMLMLAFSPVKHEELNQATTIWNTNRQFIYALGNSLCLLLLNTISFSTLNNYQIVFLFIGCLFLINIGYAIIFRRELS